MSDKCSGMYVATTMDRASPAWLDRVARCLEHDGKRIGTAERLRALCEKHRALGHDVFPLDGCDNYDASGYCMGHPARHERIKEGVTP